MSVDVTCLLVDWSAAVAACREADGTGFYWDSLGSESGDRDLPFAEERGFGAGKSFLEAAFYYAALRHGLADWVRRSADALLGNLFDLGGDGGPGMCGDLIDDVDDVGDGVGDYDGHYYSMRPSTVRAVRLRAEAFPWSPVARVAESAGLTAFERIHDFDVFRWVVDVQLGWLDEAARTDRGLIVIVSQ